MYASLPFNFLGIDENSSFDEADVVIVPVPYDATTTYKAGTREGPLAIINASRQVELYDMEFETEIYKKVGIHTMNELLPNMAGPKEQIKDVKQAVLNVVEGNKFPVMIGGEHSITLGAVQALRERYPDITVLQLDAHTDLRDTYEETKYSHACVMRRIYDEGISFAQLGVRNSSAEEAAFIKEKNIFSVSAPQYKFGYYGVEDIVDALGDTVYITIDMDVFDPSEVPAVGTPEPGGITWYELLRIIDEITFHKKVVGFDVVELAPISGNPASDFFAAKLIYKLIGYCFRDKIRGYTGPEIEIIE
ncbi:MAG TPA: agmatinase [Candidatus Aquicultor sp.]|jgi:agmatinase